MAGPSKHDSGSLKAEINVTPLVDVVLVLLIIFMVVTPLLTRGKDVRLPVAGASQSESSTTSQNAVVLTITAGQQIWLDTTLVTHNTLKVEIEKLFAASHSQEVLIKADASITVGALRPVLQRLKAAGAEEIAFAVLGEKDQSR